MDAASALSELPEVHAAVLRLHNAGTDASGIAAALGLEVEAVAPLLRVAKAKLARVLTAPDRTSEDGPRRVSRSPDAGHEQGSTWSEGGSPP
jgi:DNA-directed RNA polymerase specialized sigma24 family protein